MKRNRLPFDFNYSYQFYNIFNICQDGPIYSTNEKQNKVKNSEHVRSSETRMDEKEVERDEAKSRKSCRGMGRRRSWI